MKLETKSEFNLDAQ